jgi:hypothetical protein
MPIVEYLLFLIGKLGVVRYAIFRLKRRKPKSAVGLFPRKDWKSRLAFVTEDVSFGGDKP